VWRPEGFLHGVQKDFSMDKRLLVLASGMFAVGTDSFVVAGVLHKVSASFGVSVALAGQMVTLYALSYAALSPVIAQRLRIGRAGGSC
jgi:predicted MFS family arabinose efflux permease